MVQLEKVVLGVLERDEGFGGWVELVVGSADFYSSARILCHLVVEGASSRV